MLAWVRPGAASIDFLDESLKIPESERFREGDYTETGVGLSFGVDKRLSYLAGDYAESAIRFEAAVRAYRYKAEIWVYLARAYFYEKSPWKARDTIERAAKVMPDLTASFWDPLLDGLLGEVRRRASNLQTQLDFYSKKSGDFLTLFRLYAFLEDYGSAIDLVRTVRLRARRLQEKAAMMSAETGKELRAESRRWEALGAALEAELGALGIDLPSLPPRQPRRQRHTATPAPATPPAPPGAAEPAPEAPAAAASPGRPDTLDTDAELRAATRLLRLKTDYYLSEVDAFRNLFDNYLQLDQPEEARTVLAAMGREIARAQLHADMGLSSGEGTDYEQRVRDLEALRTELEPRLPAAPAAAGAE